MVLSKKDAIFEFEKIISKFIKPSFNTGINIDKFLKLSLSSLIDSSETIENEISAQIKAKTVHDLGKWAENKTTLEIGNLVLKLSISEILLEKWIILARMAMNLKDMKRSEMISIKYTFIGLAKAGKTSLLNYYLFDQTCEESLKTKPTLGLDIKHLESPDGIIAK